MDKSKTKNKSQKAGKSSGLAKLGIRRGSLPTIPTAAKVSNVPPIRYSSLQEASDPGTSEAESSANESDLTATDTATASSTQVSEDEKGPPSPSKTKIRLKEPQIMRRTSKSTTEEPQIMRRVSKTKQTPDELEFMTLVANGNLFEAREFLRKDKDQDDFDVNKSNFDGYSALHIAVHRQDEEMVKLLLSLQNINLYDTFFYAIKEGDVGMVKQFLEFEFSRVQSESGSFRKISMRSKKDAKDKILLKVLNRLQDYKNKTFNSEFDDDITPLMLAAQGGHYELIKMFFDAGQRLEQVDRFDCKTEKCQSQGELKMSYIRLHIYQAISNPAYICFMAMEFNTVDPILEAFNLISDLKKMASIEQEVKSDYTQLISELQEFTGELLGMCRDDTEVELLLKQRKGFHGNTREIYPRLILAVKTRETEFVTHPHTQKALYTEWTRGFESWTKMNSLTRALIFLWRTLILIFISLWQFLYSKCMSKGKDRCSEWSAPVSRFIHSLGSYVIFLILIILETNLDLFGDKFDPNDRSPPRSSVLHIILMWGILIFALGHFISTLKQFCFMPLMFFHQLWNTYEVVNHVFYIVAYILFLLAWLDAPEEANIIHGFRAGGREYWPTNYPLLIGESFFAMALIMSAVQIFRVLELHPRFGPLQIALGKMLKGICRLMVPLVTVILAFAAGMCMIFKGYASFTDKDPKDGAITKQKQGYTSMDSAAETLFWGLYGMSGLENLQILTIHLTSLGHTSEVHHLITENFAKLMYGVYHIFANIIMLNTIVAMLTGSAGEVFQNVDKQYKMGRTDIWILYGRDMKVPAPFNTIALLRNATFLRFFGLCTGGKTWSRGFNKERCCYVDYVNPESDKRLRTAYSVLVKDLLQRYFHAKATISMGEPAKLDQVNKVRETVGELRERFKVIFTGVTGVTPTRKAKNVITAVARFKAGSKKTGKAQPDNSQNLQEIKK